MPPVRWPAPWLWKWFRNHVGIHDPDETALLITTDDGNDVVRERLRYGMNQASLQIRKKAIEEPLYAGMGTTLVVLLIQEDGVSEPCWR